MTMNWMLEKVESIKTSGIAIKCVGGLALRFEDYIKNSWMLMSETDGIWKCL